MDLEPYILFINGLVLKKKMFFYFYFDIEGTAMSTWSLEN